MTSIDDRRGPEYSPAPPILLAELCRSNETAAGEFFLVFCY